jgi:hypothetical protein
MRFSKVVKALVGVRGSAMSPADLDTNTAMYTAYQASLAASLEASLKPSWAAGAERTFAYAQMNEGMTIGDAIQGTVADLPDNHVREVAKYWLTVTLWSTMAGEKEMLQVILARGPGVVEAMPYVIKYLGARPDVTMEVAMNEAVQNLPDPQVRQVAVDCLHATFVDYVQKAHPEMRFGWKEPPQ